MDSKVYIERFYKQFKTTPVLMRRALATALAIKNHLENVDFGELTFTAFGVCSESTYKDLIRPFEQQLELAKIKEEEFVTHLHDFYQSTAKRIDKVSFFELAAFVFERVLEIPLSEREDKKYHVYCAYLDLIIQMSEYLHPNQSDYNEQVVGIKTDGKLICQQEPFPNLDIPMYEIERKIFNGAYNLDTLIRQAYTRYGYDIQTEMELEAYNSILRNYDNTIVMMIPWINEYTYDLLPKKTVEPYVDLPGEIKNEYKVDKAIFLHRRRTVPSNGVKVKIEGNPLIEEIHMKEIYHADAIHMIAKVRLSFGDFLVRFNTRTGVFMSVLLDAIDKKGIVIHRLMESATLWLYEEYVVSETKEWSEYFDGSIKEREAVGGKLRAVYGRRHDLEQSDRTINGYVRKLPTGQKASDEARYRAELLGFELDDGETYVQSFIRSSWVVRGK